MGMAYLGNLPMDRIILLVGLSTLSGGTAWSESDSIGDFCELKLAPKICRWTDAGEDGRLIATIDEIERRLATTPAERSSLTKMAAADLKADPAKCEREGAIGQIYDDAVQFDDRSTTALTRMTSAAFYHPEGVNHGPL